MNYRWLCTVALAAAAWAQSTPAWVAKSNENAQVLLRVTAQFNPETAGDLGIAGLDEQIRDLQPKVEERSRAAVENALRTLETRRQAEKDSLVRQDLDILVQAAQDTLADSALQEKYTFPYFNMNEVVFEGLRSLLDDQIAPERRRAALVRLRKYAGLAPGATPITQLAMQRTRERLAQQSLLGPPKSEVEKNLANAAFFLDGIPKLFQQFNVSGYEEPYQQLRTQLQAYNEFVRKEVLPRARTDFRLPEPLYARALKNYGVDIPPAQLASMARAAFADLQGQMQQVAGQVAKQKGFSDTDYRAVIRELKKEQFVGEAILPHYKNRLTQIEEIIRREKMTLPNRAARIRLASEAESAATPAPNMRPARLVGNTGEQGEFVLPLAVPDKTGKAQRLDDFTFNAASWTLTAHEARPGHEMQFAAMSERGVSTARAVFAFNSANVEGWGLYSERILFPFMPAEGQLISLQHRLMRAARAYLDPELQSGKVTPEQALRVLRDDVVLSDAMANQEVERYMFRSPGQATSYFYGYVRLNEIRQEAEKALGAKFNQQRFHDFVLGQGLLPPTVLRKAVRDEFMKQ